MKLHIVTETMGAMEAIASGHTHIASCLPPYWIYPRVIRLAGDSKRDAINRVIRFLQTELDQFRGNVREVTEVELDLEIGRCQIQNLIIYDE